MYLNLSWYLAKTSGNLFKSSLVLSNKSSKSITPALNVLSTYSLYISPILGLLDIKSASISSGLLKYALTVIKLFLSVEIRLLICLYLYKSLSNFFSLIIEEISLSESWVSYIVKFEGYPSLFDSALKILAKTE